MDIVIRSSPLSVDRYKALRKCVSGDIILFIVRIYNMNGGEKN